LQKEASPWTDAHTKVVQTIKAKEKTLLLLHISDDELYKIVETDAINIGWGVVLKQIRTHKDKQIEEIV
jgi:hypothetical protein